MAGSSSDEQARVYLERADEYDELIRSEDAEGELLRELVSRVPLDGAVIVDVGAGTGRITRLLANRVAHAHLVERARPMLDLAEKRLLEQGATRFSLHLADARRLPLAESCADVAIAAWVFGHFRSWMPDDWQHEVSAALAEMDRVVRPAGHRVVIETLGTGHETPRRHPALDEYFAFLEERHGFVRSVIRTDYVFADVETAVRVMGGFFGAELAARVRVAGKKRVPECTAVFVARQ